ncbi:MAG: DUF4401 domain-containing protein [Sedimenticola sp.]
MNRQNECIWAVLHQAGLVQEPAPKTTKLESPWYVKVMLAFSGWLAALFLLGFIGRGYQFIIESSFASFITGGVMIAGAYTLLRIPRNDFFEHLALAVSLAGQALVVWAIFDITKANNVMGWTLVALLQAPLAVVMPNFIHRVFSSFFSAIAFSMALTSIGAPYVFSGVVMFLAASIWLNEFRYPQHMRKIRAIGYGLVVALIPPKGPALFGHGIWGLRSTQNQSELWNLPWMGEVAAGAVMLYVVWQLLQRHGQALTGRLAITALLGALVLCAVSMEAQGITVGMVIMLLGFAGGNRVLLGLGVASLLFYISSYYYLLDATLLAKAQTLLLVGLVLLAGRWLMLRMMSGEKEIKDV